MEIFSSSNLETLQLSRRTKLNNVERELKAFRHSQKIDSMFVWENRGKRKIYRQTFTILTQLIGIVPAGLFLVPFYI